MTFPPIQSYVPKAVSSKDDGVGGTSATIRVPSRGTVTLFAYTGGEHGRPFTTLEMFAGFRSYHCRLPRCYSRRWFLRLAADFAERAWILERRAQRA